MNENYGADAHFRRKMDNFIYALAIYQDASKERDRAGCFSWLLWTKVHLDLRLRISDFDPGCTPFPQNYQYYFANWKHCNFILILSLNTLFIQLFFSKENFLIRSFFCQNLGPWTMIYFPSKYLLYFCQTISMASGDKGEADSIQRKMCWESTLLLGMFGKILLLTCTYLVIPDYYLHS